MKLLSVNVSRPKKISHEGMAFSTGIYKMPVQGRAWVRALGLDGDGQADLQAHGGPDKAVYVYPVEHYDYWKHELGREDFAYGQFGENLTVEGMTEDTVHIGDNFRIGTALVEVTQPRTPCFKLGVKMGLPDFPKRFLASERSGFYLRVLEEGEVGPGDSIEREKSGPERMTVREIHHLLYFDAENKEAAAKALRIPALSPGWRYAFAKMSRNS